MKKLIVLLLILSGFFLFLSCSLSHLNEMPGEDNFESSEVPQVDTLTRSGGVVGSDPAEGVNPDFRYLYIYYNSSYVYIYLYYYNPVNLSWGNPYVYIYDTINNNDRDMIVFPDSNNYRIYRDKDANGHFETYVTGGTTVYNYSDKTIYCARIPRGYLPDIGSRKAWAYSMASTDRVPNTGYISFSSIVSVSTLDTIEGTAPDFAEFEIGYDEDLIYIEMDYNAAVSSLAWGNPYIYLYDKYVTSQNYMIAFTSSSSYEIRRDTDANGHFETFVYSGNTVWSMDGTKRYTLTIPLNQILNISTKKIWAYSMVSTDRVPNSGYLDY